ncbi:hypothetical protein AB0H77_32355 [Streptomyces sp. NPDC050844]|uniref:hypothetical protein n=1 Tax=Streptomyces sp. NPDC050844 TaxID=3155790 RepID=UPI0034085088
MAVTAGGAAGDGMGGRLRRYRARVEPAATKALLLGIFLTGLTAQFVKPVGDALEDQAFLGGALLSLVGYVLYDAVRELAVSSGPPDRGLVNSRDLGGFVGEAFQSRTVEICFLGYTGETLYNELYHRLERLLDDPGPTRRVSIRMLIPDFGREMVVPSRVGPEGRPVDYPEFRARLEERCREYDQFLSRLAVRLTQRGRVTVQCEYRLYNGDPRDKVCIFNKELVLHGLYDVAATMALEDPECEVYDPKGYNTDLSVRSRKEGTAAAETAVATQINHFEGVWKLAATPSWRRQPVVPPITPSAT